MLADDGKFSEMSSDEFIEAIERNRHLFPDQRKPNILVCGQMGVGKTTTINTLFGDEVGRVGYFSRGTTDDELYEWESHGENIDIVDLPGLGDSKKRDREYTDMYRRRIEAADGFIVVVAPPRAMNRSTIRTVNLLTQCGVNPERIIFAYNRLTDINAPIDGEVRRVRLNGLAGPETEGDAKIIEEARVAFHSELREEVRAGRFRDRFPDAHVILYDAASGWNLFAVFNAVLQTLPGDALVKWRNAVEQATNDLQRRTEARTKKLQAEVDAKIALLESENQRLRRDPAKGDVELVAQLERERSGRIESEQRARDAEYERKRSALEYETKLLEEQRARTRDLQKSLESHKVSVEDRVVEYARKAVKATVQAVKSVGRRVWNALFG